MEAFHFLECEIKRVGSAAGDTTETSIDAFAEGVDVSVTRDLHARQNTSGEIKQLVVLNKSVEMSIDKLYSSDPFLFDGNAIKLIMGNVTGTEKWQLTGATWSGKSWGGGAEDDGISYNVTISGHDFGTVS